MAPSAPQFALIVTGITDLGALGGDFLSVGDLNDFGQMVGSTTITGAPARAFFWENGAATQLFAPDMDAMSVAHGMNNLGQVVGEGGLGQTAMLWENGSPTELARLAFGSSTARAINDLGQIVGYGHDAAGEQRAVLWVSGSPNVVPTDLGTLGGDASFAHDINDVGQIVGYSRNTAAQVRPVLWQSGTPTDLGTLGGDRGDALAINDLGQIVGSSQVAPGITHATQWKNGTPTDLGTVGGTFSQANDINELGQIVGGSTDAADSSHPLLWMDGAMYDLGNPTGSTGSVAIAINNLGEVVGVTTDTRHFVRWQVAMRATIDVAPGDATNALKPGGAGTLSVAVLGSRYFDAAQIDPRTVTLGNEDARDTPVSRKKGGQPEATVRDLNRDGYADLVLDFDKKQMAAIGDLSASTTQLVLLGSRLDGRRVRGVDKVTVK
jgi:probable HAF family extracellular repeat protein